MSWQPFLQKGETWGAGPAREDGWLVAQDLSLAGCPSCWDLKLQISPVMKEILTGKNCVLSPGRSVLWPSFYRNEVQKRSGNSYSAQPQRSRQDSNPAQENPKSMNLKPDQEYAALSNAFTRASGHHGWSWHWNTSMSPNKENTMDQKKFNGRYHIWRFTAQYYINNY